VQLDKLPDDGVPKAGEVKLGELERTTPPVPVEAAVTPVPPLFVGNVPVVPPSIGKPAQLVNVPELGVPKTGVTSVGDVESTVAPDPVEVVTPVPPLATDKVPVVPATIGKPVQLVNVPEAGVFKVPPLVSAAAVVALPAVKLAAVPVKQVPAPENDAAVVAPVTTRVPPTVALPDIAL
jgi:hypothetical protein